VKHEEHVTETVHASDAVEAEVMQPEPLPEPDQEGTEQEEDVLKVSTWRRRVGYFAAALAVGLVVWTGTRSLGALWYIHPEPGDHAAFDLVKLSVKGTITVAMITFFGFLLKMGERLCLPRHLSKDAQQMATLLGLVSPSQLSQLVRTGLDAAKSGAEVVKAGADAMIDKTRGK
jgi:hypothetical protein